MSETRRQLKTAHGIIRYPTYVPVIDIRIQVPFGRADSALFATFEPGRDGQPALRAANEATPGSSTSYRFGRVCGPL